MGNSQTVDKSADKGDSHLSPGQAASAQQSATPTNDNEQTSTLFPDSIDIGPGTFEDLHKKCKGICIAIHAYLLSATCRLNVEHSSLIELTYIARAYVNIIPAVLS